MITYDIILKMTIQPKKLFFDWPIHQEITNLITNSLNFLVLRDIRLLSNCLHSFQWTC